MSTIEEEIDRFYRGELSPEELNELAYQVGEITGQDLFEGQRTASGQAIESGKAFARDFAGSFATAAEGVAELSDAFTNYIGLDDLIDSGEDNELVRLARGARESLSNYITSDPVYRDTFATKFGGGLGSFGSFLVPGGALKLAGLPKLAGATTATQAIGSGAGDQAQRLQAARDQGIEIDQATEDAAIGLGGIVGFTELLPVNRVLSKISKSADAQFKKGVVNKIKSALVTGTAEAVQEASAGVLQDAIEKGFYNEELTVGESLFDDFTVGGAVGAFADLAVSSAAGLGRGRERRKAEAAIRKTRQRYKENLAKRVSAGLEEEAELAEERVEAAGQIPPLAQALQEEYESRPYQEDTTTPEDLTEFQKILDEEMEAAGLGDIKANIFHGLRNVVKTEDGRILFGVRQRGKNEKDVKSFGRNSNLVITDEIQEGEGFYSDATGQIFLTADTLSKDKTFEEQAAEAVGTLKHEQIHAMRALDLFKDSEWNLLSNFATKQLKKGEQRSYYEWALETYKKENLSQEELIEEAIAEMTRDFRADKSIVTGKPRTLLQRIIDFFPKLNNFLKGSGYVSFDSLIRDIDSGVIGKRKRDVIRTDKDLVQFKERTQSQIKDIIEEEQETERQADFFDPNVQEEVERDKFSRSFPSTMSKLKDYPETNILASEEEAIPFELVFKDKKSIKNLLHGSGSDIDKFSTKYIGIGEGGQANGWGLYFAQLFGVSKFYKEKDFKSVQASFGKKGKNLFEFNQPLSKDIDLETLYALQTNPFLVNIFTDADPQPGYILDENAESLADIAKENGLDVDTDDAKLVIRAGLSKALLQAEEKPSELDKREREDAVVKLREELEKRLKFGYRDALKAPLPSDEELASLKKNIKEFIKDKDPSASPQGRMLLEIEKQENLQKEKIKNALDLYDSIEFKKFGKTYKASVDASLEDDILNWEKPLYEQSDALLNKILSPEDKLDLRRIRQLQKERKDAQIEFDNNVKRVKSTKREERDLETELRKGLSAREKLFSLDRKIEKAKKDNPILSYRGVTYYYDLSRKMEEEVRQAFEENVISEEEYKDIDRKFVDGVSSNYDKMASLELASKGILGHRYFDQPTVAKKTQLAREGKTLSPDEETFNFVFYVDDIITLEDKFRKKGKKTGSEEAKQAARTKLGEKAFRERYPDIKETVFADEEGITRRARDITAPTIKMSPSRGSVFVRQTPAETKFWREVESSREDTRDLLDFVPEASIIDGVFAMPPTQDNILNLREYFRDLEVGRAERTPPRFSTAKNTYLDQFYDAADLPSIQPTEVADDSDEITSFAPLIDLDTADIQSLEPLFRDKFSRKDFSIPIQVTSLDLMPTPEEVEKMRNGTFVPEKKRTLVEAAQFLQDRWEAATGRTMPYEYSLENIDLISQIFFEQAVFALERDRNAIGWYDSKLKAAKKIIKLVDPRILRTRDSEALFDFVLAVTSNGQAVIDNFSIATDIFRFHAKKGRFPETFEEFQKGGERNDAMLQAFKFHNAWQKSGQNQSIVDFLSDDYTVKELDEFAKKFNEQLGYEAMKVPSAEGVNVAVKGSYVLGPKIGQGFYQNLRGNYEPLTTDIWWMRFWNRAIGRPFKNALNDKDRNERRKEIKELMQKSSGLPRKLTNEVLKGNDQSRREIYRDPELLDSFIQDLEARYQKFYKQYKKEKGVNHVKPELFKKTGTYVKNMEPQLQADPKNASERAYIREVVKATRERLAEAGFDITTADFQALMWYPEKQLFRKLGVIPGRGEDVDYLDAAIALAEKEGISRGEIEKALRDTDRERTVDDQPSARGEDGLVREDVAGVPSRDQEKTLTREKPLTQKISRQASKIEKAVQENNEEIAKTPASRVPRYTNRADPEAQYVARNPEEGLTPDDLLKDKFSRRNEPNTSKETSDAIDKIASNAAPRKTPGETYLDITKQSRLGYFLTRLKQEAINKYARLEQYSRDPMFKDNLADSSAIAAALFADRSMGIVASALKDGVAVYRNGIVRVEDFFFEGKKYRGLVDVMAPLYQNQYGVSLERIAQAYAIIKRSENLKDKKTPIEGMSPEEIEKVKQEAMQYVDKDGNSIIDQWYKTWSAYNRKTVEFMQDTGLLTEELAQEWLAKSDYVPFYRQAEAEEGEIVNLGEDVPAMFKRSMTTSFKFAQLKGSEKAVNVPMLDAITRNLSMAIDAGMKNIAQQRIIRDMIKVGVAKKATAAQKKNKSQNFVVDFKVNGIDQSYVVRDPLIYESLQSISESGGLMWTAVGMPSKWLRELVTRSPDFMIANLIRDTLSAYVTSGADFTPVLDTITGFANGAERLERFGVVGGYDFANDPDDMVKAFSKYAKERGVKLEKNLLKSGAGAVFKPFTSLWNVLGKGTTLSDAATRNAVYNDVLARTGNEAEAAFQALEVINFSRRGRSTLARFITTAIPFLNARMQGLDVLFRGFLGVNPAQRQLTRGEAMATALARSSLITGTTLLYWLLTSDDEEYKKATDEQRDLNWLIPTGTGIPHRIPVPFEVGLLFKTIPERIFDRYPLAQTFGKPGATSGRELEESIVRGVTSTLAINPLGMQFIAPLAEAYINFDFFTRRQIVPIYLEKQGVDGLIDRYSSTEISKILGKALNISPIKIDHVLTGYTGTLGTSAILMADRAWKSLDPATALPSLSATELPIIRRFFLSKFSSDNIQDFYRLRDEIGKLESSLDKLVEQGRMTEYEALSSSQLGVADYKQDFLDINQLLAESRRNIRAIEQSEALTPEEKTMLIDAEIQDMELNTAIVPTIKRTLNLPSRTFQLVPLLTEKFKTDSEQKNAVQK